MRVLCYSIYSVESYLCEISSYASNVQAKVAAAGSRIRLSSAGRNFLDCESTAADAL